MCLFDLTRGNDLHETEMIKVGHPHEAQRPYAQIIRTHVIDMSSCVQIHLQIYLQF